MKTLLRHILVICSSVIGFFKTTSAENIQQKEIDEQGLVLLNETTIDVEDMTEEMERRETMYAKVSKTARTNSQSDTFKQQAEYKYNAKTNESSVSVDCGTLCDFEQLGVEVVVSTHYFYKGEELDKIGDFVVTFNIKESKSSGFGYMFGDELAPVFILKNNKAIKPEYDGMGFYGDDSKSTVSLAIFSEKEARRIGKAGISEVKLGSLFMTYPNRIDAGLKMLVEDLDGRRN